jgi:hypothetical protein
VCVCIIAEPQVVRTLDVPEGWEKEHDDEDHVAWLTQETVQVYHGLIRVPMHRQLLCARW